MTNKYSGVTNYTYNNDYFLTKVKYSWTDTVNFTYDKNGNRLTMRVNNGAWTNYTYDKENRLTSINDGTNYTYDHNGNLIKKVKGSDTTTYTYDRENRLVGITMPNGSIESYAYSSSPDAGCGGKCNPLNGIGYTRIMKRTPSSTVYMFYDASDLINEYNSTGSLIARYTNGPRIDEPISMRRNGQSYYYISDRLGSVVALTSASGGAVLRYIYDAWGNIHSTTGSDITNPHMFTGREYDPESGLYFYRARYYDQTIGRFLQKDPRKNAVKSGEDLYVYVGNNPANGVDPTGLYTKTILRKWGIPYGYKITFSNYETAAIVVLGMAITMIAALICSFLGPVGWMVAALIVGAWLYVCGCFMSGGQLIYYNFIASVNTLWCTSAPHI